MPRYIDADEALRMMRNSKQDNPCNTPEKGIWKTAHDCCMSCVDSVSTADVVPKSEVEQLKRNLEQCENGYRQTMHLLQCKLDNAKSEVAREVISEFKAMLKLRMMKLGIYPVALHRSLEHIEQKLTEKYTEGNHEKTT